MASIICPNCGKKNPARFGECNKCGSPLHDPSSTNFEYQIVKVRLWGAPSEANFNYKLDSYIKDGWVIQRTQEATDGSGVSSVWWVWLRRPKTTHSVDAQK